MAALILPSRRVVQPQGPVEIADYWLQRRPVLLANGANKFINLMDNSGTAVGSLLFSQSSGVGVCWASGDVNNYFSYRDYPFGGNSPISVIGVASEFGTAGGVIAGQGTEVVLRVNSSANGWEFVLNSFATNDRVSVVSSPNPAGFQFCAGTYGPTGKLKVYGNKAVAEVTPTGTYGNSPQVFTALSSVGVSRFNGYAALVGIFASELTKEEVWALSENPWQLFRPIQRRIIVDLGAGGLSQLQRTTNISFDTLGFISNDLSNSFSVRGNLTDFFGGTYNIRSLLESDTEFSYTTRGLANSSRDLSYLLRTKVTDDNPVNYNLRSAVTDTSLLNYNLRSSLIDSSEFNYNVRSTITSNESVEYRLRTLVSVDTVLNYNILSAGQVITNAVVSYKVRSNEDSSSSISWHIRSIETKDNYLVYTVRGKLEGSEELTYKVYGTTSSNLSLDSTIRGLLAKATNLNYNVLGLTQVKKDYFLLYNIISSLPPDWTDVYVKQESIFDVRIEPSSAIDIYVKGQDEFIVFIK